MRKIPMLSHLLHSISMTQIGFRSRRSAGIVPALIFGAALIGGAAHPSAAQEEAPDSQVVSDGKDDFEWHCSPVMAPMARAMVPWRRY
jgi:hypothetical protein